MHIYPIIFPLRPIPVIICNESHCSWSTPRRLFDMHNIFHASPLHPQIMGRLEHEHKLRPYCHWNDGS